MRKLNWTIALTIILLFVMVIKPLYSTTLLDLEPISILLVAFATFIFSAIVVNLFFRLFGD